MRWQTCAAKSPAWARGVSAAQSAPSCFTFWANFELLAGGILPKVVAIARSKLRGGGACARLLARLANVKMLSNGCGTRKQPVSCSAFCGRCVETAHFDDMLRLSRCRCCCFGWRSRTTTPTMATPCRRPRIVGQADACDVRHLLPLNWRGHLRAAPLRRVRLQRHGQGTFHLALRAAGGARAQR
jgi:hypothetical protein